MFDVRDPLPQSCRIVIVGGGLAGLELARALELGGAEDVCVLDAGPARDLRPVNLALPPDAALRAWLAPETDMYFHQPWTSNSPPHYTGNSGIRRRLGGRSLYWHGVTLPIEPWALAEPWWPTSIAADLRNRWHGGASLYERVLHDLDMWQRRGAPTPAAEWPRASVGGHELRATPRAIRRQTSCDRWHPYSPLDYWRDPETGAIRAPAQGVRFAPDVEAISATIDNGVVRGVIVRRAGQQRHIAVRADAVVLAAGTLENTRLAIQALTGAGALASPVLTGLADHIVQGVFVRLAMPHADRLATQFPSGSYVAPCDAARSNLFLDLQRRSDGSMLVDLQLTGEQLPSTESYVACHSREQLPWGVTVTTATSSDDRDVIAAQQDILQHVWAALARDAGCGPQPRLNFAEYDHPAHTNASVLEDLPIGVPITWSSCLGTEDHEGGTLPLGRVLDEQHQFVAIEGLFAAGPSTFPRLGAANPGLTILALARRLAAALTERGIGTHE